MDVGSPQPDITSMPYEWRSVRQYCRDNPAARRYGEMALLVMVGAWGYFANLDLSLLEGSEGLYAGIAGEMGRRREFFDLTYQGVPYVNKPPLFFWLLHASTSIWGDHEIALRLPGSLAAVGTIILTYMLGARLVSPTAGFWAALVVATSHVFHLVRASGPVRFDPDLSRDARPVCMDSGSTAGPKLTMVSARLRQHGSRRHAERDAWVFLAPARHGGLCRHSA